VFPDPDLRTKIHHRGLLSDATVSSPTDDLDGDGRSCGEATKQTDHVV
jgi:hypothetical protein